MQTTRRDFTRRSALGRSRAWIHGHRGDSRSARTGWRSGRRARAASAARRTASRNCSMDLILETGGPGGGRGWLAQIVPVTGGTFEGPKLRGKVLPPGGDLARAHERNRPRARRADAAADRR